MHTMAIQELRDFHQHCLETIAVSASEAVIPSFAPRVVRIQHPFPCNPESRLINGSLPERELQGTHFNYLKYPVTINCDCVARLKQCPQPGAVFRVTFEITDILDLFARDQRRKTGIWYPHQTEEELHKRTAHLIVRYPDAFIIGEARIVPRACM